MSPLLLLPLPLSRTARSPSSSKPDGLAYHCDRMGWIRTFFDREELFLVAPPPSSKRPLFAVSL